MAPTDRREATSLIDQLFDEPYRFEFFQAVRLLERLAEWEGRGGRDPDQPSRVDAVRFVVNQYLGFTASALQDLRPGDAPRKERDAGAPGQPGRAGPPVMTVNFFGLTGPQGVLPKLYTTYVRERAASHNDRATAAFLDLFNHRLISLFHRAWEKYRVTVDPEEGRAGVFTRALFGLIGLGHPALRGRQAIDDDVLLSFAAGFSRQRRTAEGLETLIRDACGLPARFVPFVGRWVEVDPSQRLRLAETPGGELGGGFVLGSRVYDEQGKFRLRIGPLSADDFRSLLPDRPRFRVVTELTRLYAGPEFDFDVELYLKPGAVPPAVAGGDRTTSAQLGRFAWFRSEDPGREHGAVFESGR